MGKKAKKQEGPPAATLQKIKMRTKRQQQDNNKLPKLSDDPDEILDAFDDEEFMALALSQLGWDPFKEILEVLSVASQDENLGAKMQAIKYLEERRDTIRRRAGKLVDVTRGQENEDGSKTVFSSEILSKTLETPNPERKEIQDAKQSEQPGQTEQQPEQPEQGTGSGTESGTEQRTEGGTKTETGRSEEHSGGKGSSDGSTEEKEKEEKTDTEEESKSRPKDGTDQGTEERTEQGAKICKPPATNLDKRGLSG